MDASSVSNANAGSVQGQAQISMMKKQMDMQESQVAQLLQAVPQPPKLAEPGQPGSRINTFA